MKKSLYDYFLNISPATVSSNAWMGGLDASRARPRPPKVPFASEMVKVAGFDICLHTYDPDFARVNQEPKALVVFLHGANTHGAFPTTRLVADFLVANGYAFMAPDFPGHGKSSGVRGYVETADSFVNFGVGIVEEAYRIYLEKIAEQKASQQLDIDQPKRTPGLKLFVVGSSMGGNITLQVTLRRKGLVSGVILLAPMLRISLINPLSRFFIKNSAAVLPKTEAIPVGKNNSYRCPKIAEECEKDTLKPHKEGDRIRLGTVKSLVELTDTLESKFEQVSCPCLVMVGDEDKTVNNQGALDLMKRASSMDMTLKRYPALHGLMGEPSPLVEKIQDDLLRWLDERSGSRDFYIPSSL